VTPAAVVRGSTGWSSGAYLRESPDIRCIPAAGSTMAATSRLRESLWAKKLKNFRPLASGLAGKVVWGRRGPEKPGLFGPPSRTGPEQVETDPDAGTERVCPKPEELHQATNRLTGRSFTATLAQTQAVPRPMESVPCNCCISLQAARRYSVLLVVFRKSLLRSSSRLRNDSGSRRKRIRVFPPGMATATTLFASAGAFRKENPPRTMIWNTFHNEVASWFPGLFRCACIKITLTLLTSVRPLPKVSRSKPRRTQILRTLRV
jgi:hypothetical protein